MGWWHTGIMDGDTPLDIAGDFQEAFGSDGTDSQEDFDYPPFRVPTANESMMFLTKALLRSIHVDEEHPIIRQVTGYLLIQRGAPMNDVLRKMIIDGIVNDSWRNWDDPEGRVAVLKAFRKVVEEYSDDGAKGDLPD